MIPHSLADSNILFEFEGHRHLRSVNYNLKGGTVVSNLTHSIFDITVYDLEEDNQKTKPGATSFNFRGI